MWGGGGPAVEAPPEEEEAGWRRRTLQRPWTPELVKLPALTTVYLHYNHWAAAAGGAEGEQEHRPVGWSVHYPPKPEELLSKAEYKRQVLEALPKLEQLDDTYR